MRHVIPFTLAALGVLGGCSEVGETAGNGGNGAGGGNATAGSSPGAGGSSNGIAGSAGPGPSGAGTSSNGGVAPMLTCSEAATPFSVSTTALEAGLAPAEQTRAWGSELFASLPVAVHPETGLAYVGFTRAAGDSAEGVVVKEGGTAADAITVAGATLGGLAVLPQGFGVLAFDPNEEVDARTWAAVKRLDAQGLETQSTDLFRSPNLDDVGTKGAPGTSRLGYVASSDLLIPYFGHTQRYDDGVRHQGGYLASVDAAGMQKLYSGWFGSHNLDQRLLVSGDTVALLGLGDAYPKGVFFSSLVEKPKTNVLYLMAGNGSGTTNGQLGGIVDLDDQFVVPFITNRSISQELTPGDWPDIDPAISDEIEAAANNGNEVGLLHVPKSGDLPDGDLTPTWVDVGLAAGAHLESLKSARYGAGGLILLAFAEVTGENRSETRSYFTLVIDAQGAVCQPKAPLPTEQSFTSGDDLVRRPNGTIVWANLVSDVITFVTLTPG